MKMIQRILQSLNSTLALNRSRYKSNQTIIPVYFLSLNNIVSQYAYSLLIWSPKLLDWTRKLQWMEKYQALSPLTTIFTLIKPVQKASEKLTSLLNCNQIHNLFHIYLAKHTLLLPQSKRLPSARHLFFLSKKTSSV